MAMRKEIADLSVRFGADGTRGLQQDIARVGTALGKLKAASFSAIGGLGKISVGLGVGALAGVGALTALAAANDDYVSKLSNLSNLSGIQITAMSRLAAGARRYGVDLDDLRGAMGQFIGQVADGADGGAAAEEFAKLGISAQQLKDNLNDPLKVLLMVGEAQKKLSGAERTGVLSKLFGEDDSVKMVGLLDALGSGSSDLVEAIDNINDAGAIVTPEDVKVSRDWNNAMGDIGDVMRGLSLEIGRTVLPTVTKLVKAFAGFMRDNKNLITGQIAGAWKRVGQAIEPVYKLLYAGERGIQGTWLEPVVRWLRQAGETIATVSRGTGDLFDTLSGKKIGKEFPWMTDFAAGIKRMAEGGVSAIDFLTAGLGTVVGNLVPYLGDLPALLDSLEGSWAQLQAAFETGVGDGFLAETGRLFRDLWDGAVGVRNALSDIANGKSVDPQFEWVQSAVTALSDIADLSGQFLTQMVHAVGQVIENFGEIRYAIEQTFGIDVTQMGLWIAFAQFSGVANTFLIAAGIVLGVLGSLAGAAFIAGIALGYFLGKWLQAQEWANEPVKAFVGFIDEITGDAQRLRDFWAENQRAGDEYLAQRAKLAGMSVDDFLKAGGGAADSPLPGAPNPQLVAPTAQSSGDPDIQSLIKLAQGFADGSALQSSLTFQSNVADIKGARANLGQTVVMEGKQSGTPVLIQLSPTQEAVTVYAETPDIAAQLVDLVNKAKRASTTRIAPSFAGVRPR